MSDWQDYVDTHLPAATTDAERTAAIQGALDLVPPHGYRRLKWPRLTLPWGEDGEWKLAADSEGVCLRIRDWKQVHLDLGGCSLLRPPGATGILVERDGDWTIIRDGSVAGIEATDTTGTGIRIEGPSCKLERLVIMSCAIGLHLYGEGGVDYNADSIRSWALDIHECVEGIVIEGADTNGGCHVGHVCFGGDIGIRDHSFLGNCHVGHQIHTTRLEAIKLAVSTANYSTYVGTYMEADCGRDLPGYETNTHAPITSVAANATWLGGGVIPKVTVGDRVGLGWSRLRFREPLAGGGDVTIAVPHGSNLGALTITRSEPDGSTRETHSLRWRDYEWARDFGFVPTDAGTPNDGLHMALGWTASGHPRGTGHPLAGVTPARVKGRLLVPDEEP